TNLIKNVGGNVYYDGSNFTYLDENGTTQTINISNIVKANETVTTLVKNANGTYTYKNEKQQEVTLDPSMVNVSFANGVYTFKDAEGNVLTTINTNADHITYNNTTSGLTSKDVQGAIDELLATIKTIQGTKGDLTAGDASIVVGNGTGATLINANVKVADSGITTAKIAGKSVTSDKLTAGTGTDGRIAIADKDGNVTYSDAIPGTSVSGQNVTAASNKVVLGGTPTGAALKAFSVDVDESKLSLQNIGGKVTNNQITAGTDGQVLITEGTTTKWVDKTTISPETTNTLVNNGTNTLTSTVNGKAATASVVNGVSNTITGTGLVTTVNGVASPSVDLKDAIQAGQHKTIVAEGSGITVTPAQGTNTTTYTVSANPATLTLSGDVTGAANATKVEKIQGTPISATNPTANQVLTFDGTNWIPKVPSVDVTGVTGGKALTSTDLDLSTNAGTALLKDVTANIKAKAVTAGKLGATAADAGKVATANADGTVTYQAISATNLANAKNLTAGDGSISVASGTGATLVDANVKVTDGGITSIKLADKNVTAAKLGATAADAGKVATANADGTVTYQAISATNLSDAKNLTAASGNRIVVTDGTGTVLKNTTLDVNESNLRLQNIGGALNANQVAGGTSGQVMTVGADGKGTWVDKTTISPETTNTLVNNGTNTLTSTINGKVATAPVVNGVSNTITGTGLVTTVNGVASASVDLKDAIQSAQKTTTVVAGSNVSVTPAAPNATGNTAYTVNVSTAAANTLGVVKPGTGLSVDANGTLSVNTGTSGIGKTLSAGDGSIVVGTGTGATLVDANVKVADAGITSIKLADKNVTAAKLGASAADAGKVATANADGTVTYQAISAGNLTNAKTLSAGDGSIVVGAGTGATLVDANVKVADAGITTIKLADKNVTAGKIAPGAANQVLVTDATGANAQWVAQSTLADNTTADNGLTKTGNNVQLGGSLTKATTITATATNTLAVAGLQNTAAAAYNGTNGISTDRVVVADASGVLKQVKATMPKFFYMPSIIVPTAADQFVAETGVSGESFGTINLYDRYKKQFGTPMAQNAAVTTALPVLPSGELDYYITWYDTNVFASVSVSNAGILTYTVKANADVTIGSFMNIVFAVKP
ncbi:beta strand repeat-containing protein, partial [Sphingobacterium spiritivorum]